MVNKHIVTIKKVMPQGTVTIDSYNPIFEIGFEEALDQMLPQGKIFEQIIVKNFTSISSALLTKLTPQYLRGCEIVFDTKSRKFHASYKLPITPKDLYSYKWELLDFSKPIPKALANLEFKLGEVTTTYLNYLNKNKSSIQRYIPNELWVALDQYSQDRIKKCQEYNNKSLNYTFAEEWYKLLYKQVTPFKIKIYSPNDKTIPEAKAEVEFLHEIVNNCRLQDGLQPLNEEQVAFLRKYAKAYGVEIPTFQWKINSRKTKHGYTQEPERVFNGMSHTEWEQVIVDQRNVNRGLTYKPAFVRQGLVVKESENDKFIRDAYFQLLWIMKHMGDQALMPGYKRCPVCHKIYREHDGCECGACPPIELVSADHLLFGISSTYEDYDSTSSAYDSLLEESME